MNDPKNRNGPCPCGSGVKWKRCCRAKSLAEQNAEATERHARIVARKDRQSMTLENGTVIQTGLPALDKAMEGGIPPAQVAVATGDPSIVPMRRRVGMSSALLGLLALGAMAGPALSEPAPPRPDFRRKKR